MLVWRMLWGVVAAVFAASAARAGEPPAQRVPSAVLVYPVVQVEGGGATVDTRVEILNLARTPTDLQCYYVSGSNCMELDFFVSLTPNQPLSWLVSKGTRNLATFTAVPPFFGSGQLKCVVLPEEPVADRYNAVQGRAVVFGSDGQTFGYGAVGFRRLADGEFSRRIDLDGSTYAQCPDELHFAFNASDSGSDSELILVPCSEDVLARPSTPITVSFRVINEFEQMLSASTSVSCSSRKYLRQLSSAFTRATLGSDTGHVVARGVQGPVVGVMIDRFSPGALSTSGNEPFLRGGRSATLVVP